jgi:hypothetical protein
MTIAPEKLMFTGVPIKDPEKNGPKYTPVRLIDVEELRDHLYENLLEPTEEGMMSESSSYYFTAARLAMQIANRAVKYFESEQTEFALLNTAVDAPIVQRDDSALEQFAANNGIETKPTFANHPSKLDYYIAIAKWRMTVKKAMEEQQLQAHLKMQAKKDPGNTSFDLGE